MKSIPAIILLASLLVPGVCLAQAPPAFRPVPTFHGPPAGPEISVPPVGEPVTESVPVGEVVTEGVEACAGGPPVCCADGAAAYPPFRFQASYLLWWLSQDSAPLPVLTTGGSGQGILGQPDTTVLLRAGDVGPTGGYSGGDFGLNYWLDGGRRFGLNVRGFFLAEQSHDLTFAGDSLGSPLLSIPFTDLNPILPGPSFTQVANPGASTGRVRFDNSTQLWGIEGGFDLPSLVRDRLLVTPLIGFRYLNLEEDYSIVQTVTSVGGQQLLAFAGNAIPAADSLQITDSFATANQFYGANLAARANYQLGDGLWLNVVAKVALGETNHTLNVAGSTQQLTPAAGQLNVVQSANGGLFAQPYNSGRFTGTSFGVIPEVGARLGWDITNWAELTAGYNFLYWNRVVRPASQIPGAINTTTAPSQATFGGGGPIPATPGFRYSDLTVHGVNFGLVLRF